MDVSTLGPEGRYSTRRLGPPDLRDLQALLERASDYFEVMTGSPPGPDEAERAFVGGPPSKAVSDKHTVGVFDDTGGLVGVLDAIPHYPADGTCTIGMLLLDPAVRGRGLGSSVLAAFEGWMLRQGARRLRTALVTRQGGGVRFLERAGYVEVSRTRGAAAAGAPATIAFFERELPRTGA